MGGEIDDSLGRRQDLSVPPGPQGRVDAQLLGFHAQLLEAMHLDARRLPVIGVDKRAAPPQHEALVDGDQRPFRVAEHQQLARPPERSLEATHVQLLGGDRQPVTVRFGADGPRTEGLAETHNTALDDLAPRRRDPLAPQRVGEALAADDLAALQRQGRQHHTIAWRQPRVGGVHLQWTKHRYPHGANCP